MAKFRFSLVMMWMYFMTIVKSETTTNVTNCYLCSLENTDTILRCTSIVVDDTEELRFSCISTLQKRNLTTLIIENSTIPRLNLNFIRENEFSGLSEISIYDSAVVNVTGSIPCHISSLTIPKNSIRSFSAILDDTVEGITDDEDAFESIIDIDDNGHFTTTSSRPPLTNCTNDNFTLVINNNLLEELPVEFVGSKRLKSLFLSENPLKCEFIWENVWDHLECQHRSLECRNLFVDQNVTTCQFYRQKLVPSGIFFYNLTQIFDSKITLEKQCTEMNKTCECHPFNLLRDEKGKPTVYLTVNCFGKNFSELPRVSEYTWELNVSYNRIQRLNTLNHSMYQNLRRLDIRNNLIDSLNDVTNSIFMKKFDLLYISSNKFEKIPDSFLTKVRHSEGKAMLKIGSQLDCDCITATQTKGRLIEIQNHILDMNDVVCWNVMQQQNENLEGNETEGIFSRVKEMKITDVCSLNEPNDVFNWIMWIIIIEVLCIFSIILKVLYDWREYHRTGILPWIAEKLPRLPCDGILE